MNLIEKYYNKFNEDKRLKSRHGIVEFSVTMDYIQKYIEDKNAKILDIGAGTGAYSIFLSNKGYEVTAVELVKKNLSVLKQKTDKVKTFLANALDLGMLKDEQFDIVLLLGPLYHLFSEKDKIKALMEARRVLKPNGILFVAYLLADYAFIRHAIMDNFLRDSINAGKIDQNFNIISSEEDLYSYVRLNEIDNLNDRCGLKRIKIIAPDGATDYIRNYINKLSEEDFETYIRYQKTNCERPELIGASSHVLDILKKD